MQKRITASSSLYLPINQSGHVFYAPRPCIVIGLYVESTGSIILETVLCDGEHYDTLQLSKDDFEKCYDALQEAVLALQF